ncbi:hypothetical protein D477_015411 [Arthrobacter crystallopoietes BAB-32]|uniref:Uncharacterized protein n=1 Tax=Arthrobacter crystallopoietes BAB-32 TaxID=1246476 RepID=N1UZV4_9MICC|nr:putative transporter small subunit [Arthrobacter crystallopoietes]EMY33342.1 hypothetical protein D477_015411 [Arthrobacter crystallopoietes BAB-32]
METFVLTLYVLVWPLIVAGTLFGICKGFFKDWREARQEGRTLI